MNRNLPSRFRPCLEALEDRSVPAVIVTFSGGTLELTGDDTGNGITIFNNGNGHITGVATGAGAFNGGAGFFNVDQILVHTGNGTDGVGYFVQGDEFNPSGKQVRGLGLYVFMGKGNDGFNADFRGNDISRGVSVFLTVFGEEGNDDITFNAKGVDIAATSQVLLTAVGGNDNDTLSADYSGVKRGNFGVHFFGDNGSPLPAGFGQDRLRLGARFRLGRAPNLGSGPRDLELLLDGDEGDDSLEMILHATDPLSVTGAIDGGDGFDTATHVREVQVQNCEKHIVSGFGGTFTKAPPLGGGALGGRFQL